MPKQLVEAPADCLTLGYIEAYDAMLNCDYAYVAYKEGSGEDWPCLRRRQEALQRVPRVRLSTRRDMPPWLIAVIGVAGVVALGVVQDLLKEGSSSLLKAGWRRLTGKSSAPVTPDRKAEAIAALHLNVASTNKRLRDIIEHVVKGNFTSPELRGALYRPSTNSVADSSKPIITT